MTQAQRYLLSAAKDALDWFVRRERGDLPRGMYDDLGISRALASAVEGVDRESQETFEALVAEQLK